MISAIVAVAHDNVIGNSGELPWYLPADLKHFRELTTGHVVIMGRTTHESIVKRLGHVLPDRRTIVVTRDVNYAVDGGEVAHSIDEALQLAGDEDVFITGGAQIYKLAEDSIDTWYVTEIHMDIQGDTYLDGFDATLFHETSRELFQPDEKNEVSYSFVIYERA